ncbi:DeoR/GlpR family DNA-binding transcription regulator [Sinomicrobium weinanense]|uniref:DeoR/GlpR transcriptional regulator n=1 Tax=Sinomicrobium weinanense TaxID=2842200 RepID=A0A926Q488_9FLAO|nr:DeoR/GlpR family DNA-binding transcription regulator [Sinomicrobium weinanense]MBC9798368.1 DeoR/GlpR transcriptional regulator [Sinomicrobium weinanense]MBU3125343.1 DeoR/GlpR family DNA-binding transcription regulator [Sinomicrobium weinanense]
MLKEERHQLILNEVELHSKVLLIDLSEKLNVSIDTVRRDVKELDKGKKLKKVHGGAVSLGFNSYTRLNTNIYALDKKHKIAEKAVALLKNGDAILIHGGTTCLEFARMIPSKLNITYFTLSLPVAMELLRKNNSKVILIGGLLSHESQITIGANAVHALSEIRVDYGFIGTGYADAKFGLTGSDWESEQVKKAVIKASRKVILLTISEKLNSQHRYKTCDLNTLDTMITELEPHDPALIEYRNQLNLL